MPRLAIHADDVAELKQLVDALPEAISALGKFLGSAVLAMRRIWSRTPKWSRS